MSSTSGQEASRRAEERIRRASAWHAYRETARMEYAFLYDNVRHLLAIGYNVGDNGVTRVTTICWPRKRAMQFRRNWRRGQLPQDSWFALGRAAHAPPAASRFCCRGAVRCSSTLMPLLVMPTYENTPARSDLPGGGAAADRIREPARRSLGHVGIRLQHTSTFISTTIRALACPDWGLQARTGGGLGHCALCLRARSDGSAEAASLNLQRLALQGGREDTAFTRRSTTRHRVGRAGNRAPWVAIVHDASQGMISSLCYDPGPVPCRNRFESDPAESRHHVVVAGANSKGYGALLAHTRSFRHSSISGGSGWPVPRARPPTGREAGVAADT